MTASIQFQLNKASIAQIAAHLTYCDADFIPPLSGRVEIVDYAKKITEKAIRVEAWSGTLLVGLVAMYCNDSANQLAFVTSVSLLKNWTGTGIASQLLGRCLEHAKVQGIREIMLQVAQNNLTAIKLYKKHGFVDWKSSHSFIYMNLFVETGEDYEQ